MYKFYVMSKINHHALGVIDENESTVTVQKLKVEKVFNKFSNSYNDEIVPDLSVQQINNAVLDKNDLSLRIEDVNITKDYWEVFEYLTGRKKKSVVSI